MSDTSSQSPKSPDPSQSSGSGDDQIRIATAKKEFAIDSPEAQAAIKAGLASGKINAEQLAQLAEMQAQAQGQGQAQPPAQPKTPSIKEGKGREIIDPVKVYRDALYDDSDMPITPTIVLYTVFFAFLAFIIWANWATLDEVTRGEGRIIPSSKVKEVQGVDKGQIEKIFITEGQSVRRGDPLLSISSIEARSNFLSNQVQVLALQARIARLKAEVEGHDTIHFSKEVLENAADNVVEERNAFSRNKDQIESQLAIEESLIQQREQEIREAQSQIRDNEKVIELSRQEMELIRPLVESGAAPKVELIQLERAMKEREATLNSLRQSIPRIRSSLVEAQSRKQEVITNLRSAAQNQLSETLSQMQSTQERLAAYQDIENRTTLVSPVDGVVQSINENLGGVVEPGEPLVEIVPDDDSLLIEAKIKPSDIAFLHPGQLAKIKVTAYDFSVYGGLDGELIDISPDSITDDRGNTHYRVRLRTTQNALVHKGQKLPLITGMVTNVDILTGRKTVMEYLMKPIIKTLKNSLHER